MFSYYYHVWFFRVLVFSPSTLVVRERFVPSPKHGLIKHQSWNVVHRFPVALSWMNVFLVWSNINNEHNTAERKCEVRFMGGWRWYSNNLWGGGAGRGGRGSGLLDLDKCLEEKHKWLKAQRRPAQKELNQTESSLELIQVLLDLDQRFTLRFTG